MTNEREWWVRVALLLLPLLSACASAGRDEPGSPAPTGPIVVASDLENPPFAYVDDEGRPAGRDVEMMTRVAELVGRELHWRRMPFPELLDRCAAGGVDVVCATLGVTEERARRVGFTVPYYETALAVLVRTGEGEPAILADLVGRRVGAGAGTTSESAVRSRLFNSHGVFGPKSADLLVAGGVDAAVMDGPNARALAASSAGKLRVLPQDLGSESYALAVAPERGELLRDLDRALRVFAESGTLAELDRRFGL